MNEKLKNVLYLKFLTCDSTQLTTSAKRSNIGFITLDQSGVLAANSTFPHISHTIKTSASGPFVMNPVIAQSHFTFCSAESISSILSHTKNIKTIIQIAHNIDVPITHHINRADNTKNSTATHHIIISSFQTEALRISFMIFNYF
jgi:hypothetical protein